MFRMTPGVKWLLIVNCVMFVVYFLAAGTRLGQFLMPLGLMPNAVLMGAIWQPFTYLFLHSPYGFSHILMNMLTLWMFGTPLEGVWGTRQFLKYYFFCGVGAGICVVVLNLLAGTGHLRTIGASGAIYGLLLAFGILFPRATIYFFMMFPIEARWYVLIMGAIVFLSAWGDAGGGVSHFAHLGGMVFGYVWLRMELGKKKTRGPRRGWVEQMEQAYKDWKFRRAKKKFQVYLKKQGSDRKWDDTVH